MYIWQLGPEVAAGASCKILKGAIELDGRMIELAVKDFVYDAEQVDEIGAGGEGLRGSTVVGMRSALMSGAALGEAAAASALEARAAEARANPRWLADCEHASCMLGSKCGHVSFSPMVRRQHCRYCGWVVCAVSFYSNNTHHNMISRDRLRFLWLL